MKHYAKIWYNTAGTPEETYSPCYVGANGVYYHTAAKTIEIEKHDIKCVQLPANAFQVELFDKKWFWFGKLNKNIYRVGRVMTPKDLIAKYGEERYTNLFLNEGYKYGLEDYSGYVFNLCEKDIRNVIEPSVNIYKEYKVNVVDKLLKQGSTENPAADKVNVGQNHQKDNLDDDLDPNND